MFVTAEKETTRQSGGDTGCKAQPCVSTRAPAPWLPGPRLPAAQAARRGSHPQSPTQGLASQAPALCQHPPRSTAGPKLPSSLPSSGGTQGPREACRHCPTLSTTRKGFDQAKERTPAALGFPLPRLHPYLRASLGFQGRTEAFVQRRWML